VRHFFIFEAIRLPVPGEQMMMLLAEMRGAKTAEAAPKDSLSETQHDYFINTILRDSK
jgi:hypothetical protein